MGFKVMHHALNMFGTCQKDESGKCSLNKTTTLSKKMAVDVLLGLQWGDEGKGKIVDVLTSKYDIIARFQGGTKRRSHIGI